MKRTMFRIVEKAQVLWALSRASRPQLPVILDSLRLQHAPYTVTHVGTGVTLRLLPRCGDWFTYFECLVRNDYLTGAPALRKGDRVLDIGGNYGAFSLLAGRLVGPTGSVHCYEPSPAAAERIAENIDLNGATNIHLENWAVGAVDGTDILHVFEKSAYNSIHALVDGRTVCDAKQLRVGVVAINHALSEISGQVAFVKIDCEGAEFGIMEAISDENLDRISVFSIETHDLPGHHPSEICDRLQRAGFVIKPGNPLLAVHPRAPR